jgi:hypothetical protein
MIPFNAPPVVGTELDYMQSAMGSGKLCGDGGFTRRCQQWMEQRFHSAKVLLTPSCTASLEMAALLLDIGPGDEVIMPSYTFVSTANAFVLRGAKIVFVDVRPDTMNIDERLIEAAITDKTRAIVPVHYAGVACEMDTIMAIAKKHNLFVVEDAAQFPQPGDHRKNVLHHLWRQPHGGLVQDQQTWEAEQSAVERQQLLLTAGEQPGKLMLAFAKTGEAFKNLGHFLPDGDSVTTKPGPHLQVLQHRHAGENPAAFRHHYQPVAQQRFGLVFAYRFAIKRNITAKTLQSGNCAHGGAFPRTVGANQRGLLTLMQGE